MTLDEARKHIGDGVIYTPGHGPEEGGVITGVSSRTVFVRYTAHQVNGTATSPEDLRLATA